MATDRKILTEDISCALNRHSAENLCNTPAHLLAEYLVECLYAFARATRAREKWYGQQMVPAQEGAKTFHHGDAEIDKDTTDGN